MKLKSIAVLAVTGFASGCATQPPAQQVGENQTQGAALERFKHNLEKNLEPGQSVIMTSPGGSSQKFTPSKE